MNSQPPGWHPDPWQPDTLRYHDGVQWTPHVAVATPFEPPKPPHPTLPLAVAGGALASMAVPLVASRFILRALAPLHWPIAIYVILLAAIAYAPPVVFLRYASRRWGSGDVRADIGLRMRSADVGWGALTWLSCIGAQAAVGAIIIATRIPVQGNTDQIRDARDHPGYIIPILVVAVVVAPIIEEIIFRGLVLRGFLSRMGPVTAIGAQAVLFGVAHVDPARGVRNFGLVLVLSAVGAVLGGSTYLLRRLGPNMIAHGILNTVVMVIVLSGWTPGST